MVSHTRTHPHAHITGAAQVSVMLGKGLIRPSLAVSFCSLAAHFKRDLGTGRRGGRCAFRQSLWLLCCKTGGREKQGLSEPPWWGVMVAWTMTVCDRNREMDLEAGQTGRERLPMTSDTLRFR